MEYGGESLFKSQGTHSRVIRSAALKNLEAPTSLQFTLKLHLTNPDNLVYSSLCSLQVAGAFLVFFHPLSSSMSCHHTSEILS